jgi:hypothetical protein
MYDTWSLILKTIFSTCRSLDSCIALMCDRYQPGDVAIIHPRATDIDVESFLNSMGYANSADDLITIEHTMSGIFSSRLFGYKCYEHENFRPVPSGPPSENYNSSNPLHPLHRLQCHSTTSFLQASPSFYYGCIRA